MGIFSPHSNDLTKASIFFWVTSSCFVESETTPLYPVSSILYRLGCFDGRASPEYHSFVLMALYVGHGCSTSTKALPRCSTACLSGYFRCLTSRAYVLATQGFPYSKTIA